MFARTTLVFALVAYARAEKPFEVKDVIVPEVAGPDQSVDIECIYDAEFTVLKWFKGKREFFRYTPGETPSIKTYAALGIGNVEPLVCGPNACRLRLGNLSEEASGSYRCDIEREKPPYKFAAKTAHMTVKSADYVRPKILGVMEEYDCKEGEMIKAECLGNSGADLIWYVNGQEHAAFSTQRGNSTLILEARRDKFPGSNDPSTLQCAEYTSGNLTGSSKVKVRCKQQNVKSKATFLFNSNVFRLLLTIEIFSLYMSKVST